MHNLVADRPTIEVRTQIEAPYLNLLTMIQSETHLQPPVICQNYWGIPIYYVAMASLISYFSFWLVPGEPIEKCFTSECLVRACTSIQGRQTEAHAFQFLMVITIYIKFI
jgi:hypothetical protein